MFDFGREYQNEDIPWFLRTRRSFILYEPRMGKTVVGTAVCALDPEVETILILCPKNAFYVWRDHLIDWYKRLAPDKRLDIRLVKGQASKPNEAAKVRFQKWTTPCKKGGGVVTVYICSYASFRTDAKYLLARKKTLEKQTALKLTGPCELPVFHAMLFDEYHMQLKNHKGKTLEALKLFARDPRVKRIHPLSGTPTSKNGPVDFFGLLQLMYPKTFTSYWRYVGEFMDVVDMPFGKQVFGIRDQQRWYTLRDKVCRIRTRAEHAKQMPKVVRTITPLDPTPEQYMLWTKLRDEKMVMLPDKDYFEIVQNSLELKLRTRQITVSPKLLNPEFGWGASIEALCEWLDDPDVPEEDKFCVVYTPFREAVDIIRNGIKALCTRSSAVYRLYGGIDPEDQSRAIKGFQRDKGIMICTIMYAQAFSLAPAKVSHFIGFEWDPNALKQAEDRIVSQEGDIVGANYFAYEAMDLDMVQANVEKTALIQQTLATLGQSQK